MASKTAVVKAIRASKTQEEAANRLGMSRSTLYGLRKSYNLKIRDRK